MSEQLYKSRDIHSKEYRQSRRRHELLEIQKQRRIDLVDEHRSIEPLRKLYRNRGLRKNVGIKNQLMLSEWLKEVPDDIDKWYIKPCPKGVRVLVIAVDGATWVFNKHGCFMKKFRSELPGDHRNKRDLLTILDCIYVDSLQEFFVLDVLAYGSQAFIDCEAEFRFFWIESQIRELGVDEVSDHNEYPFRIIEKCSCDDQSALNELLSKYPMWSNNQPELDGLLFYHKEASYVHGTTPLVGWLYAFMIPELFDVLHLNENYMTERPADYFNYLTFMEKFDDNLREKRKNRRKKRIEHMDEEAIEDDDGSASVVQDTMELERGLADDDYNDHHTQQHEFEMPI